VTWQHQQHAAPAACSTSSTQRQQQ
jgi:hypothetical protein